MKTRENPGSGLLWGLLGIGAAVGLGYALVKLTGGVQNAAANQLLTPLLPSGTSTTPVAATQFTGGEQVAVPSSAGLQVAVGNYALLIDSADGGVTGGAVVLVAVTSISGTGSAATAMGTIQGIVPVPNGTPSTLSIGQSVTFNVSDAIGVTDTLPSQLQIAQALEAAASTPSQSSAPSAAPAANATLPAPAGGGGAAVPAAGAV